VTAKSESNPPDDDAIEGDAVPAPGDSQQVPVPNEHALEGSSERTPKAEGILTYPEKSEPDP